MWIPPTITEYIDSVADKPFYDGVYYNENQITEIINTDEFQMLLANTIDELFGDYKLRKRYFHFGADNSYYVIQTEKIKQSVMTLYVRNKYKYDKLYETTVLEYNPLDNVDETDHWTEQHSGEDITTEDIGSKSNQEKIGNRSDSMTYGSRTDTSTHDVAPYETGYQPKDKTTTTDGGHTDSAVTGAQDNQYIEGAQTNIDTMEHGHLITYDRRRHGNIGVTSAMDLITQQRKIADFSFVEIVARDIMEQIAIGVLN